MYEPGISGQTPKVAARRALCAIALATTESVAPRVRPTNGWACDSLYAPLHQPIAHVIGRIFATGQPWIPRDMARTRGRLYRAIRERPIQPSADTKIAHSEIGARAGGLLLRPADVPAKPAVYGQ